MADNEKTEKATPRKKEEERKKGNIFQSKDVSSAFALVGIFLILRVVGPFIFGYSKHMMSGSLSSFAGIDQITIKSAVAYMNQFLLQTLLLSLPVSVTAAGMGILLAGAQTRFNFSMDQVKPKFSRLDPISGLKKMLTLRSLVELIKSSAKIVLIAWILYTEIKSDMVYVINMTGYEASQSFFWVCRTIYGIGIKIGLIMGGFAVLDYFYQWWEYEKQLRMSKQDIKDEYKKTEGDPKIKGRIREQQRRMASMRMMHKVPTADVVIKNPTHYAVALKYEAKKNKSPTVIAKGKDYVALKIIEIAEQNGVAVTENKPLARGLYETVELDHEIPEEYYLAVANVLAFVYNLKKRGKSI